MDTIHNRHSIRLKEYDYSQPGGYFITLVTHEKEYLFGSIEGGEMKLNEIGEIANEQWLQIPARFGFVELAEFVIMPNHIHGILIFHEPVGAGFTPARIDKPGHTQPGQPQPGKPQIGQLQTGQPQGLPLRETHNEIAEIHGLTRPRTLGDVVGAYKSLVANECLNIYKIKNETMGNLWQRNYYEHIIRSEQELTQIAEYILSNPAQWESDGENLRM